MSKSYYSYNPCLHRTRTFSYYWFEIFRTRLLLATIAIIFAFTDPGFNSRGYLFPLALSLYITSNVALGFIASDLLQLRRVRLIPDIFDILFVSALIFFTGGQSSYWFLVYIFPVISASRYLGAEGSMYLAVFSLTLYTALSLYMIGIEDLNLFSLALKSFSLLGVALTAGNLSRTRKTEEQNLIAVSTEIHNAILSNLTTSEILKLILERALKYTDSDHGEIRLIKKEISDVQDVTTTGKRITLESTKGISLEDILEEVIKSKSPRIYPSLSEAPLINLIKLPGLILSSYLLVPLMLKEEVIGIVIVASPKRIHYSEREVLILEGFARFSVLAIQNAQLIKSITSAAQERAKERKERLKMLHSISNQLVMIGDLNALFNNVVGLTFDCLNSEEAALFLSEGDEEQIKKVAVRAPDDVITKLLQKNEYSYKVGESYTGEVFKFGQPQIENNIKEDIEYGAFYRQILPSRCTKHYLGVPLIISDQVLGVLRVLNKRSASYSLEKDNVELSEAGFDNEDLELMQTIASQVAVAIQHTRLLYKYKSTQAYYSTLVASSPDPIIALDNNGKIVVFNKACELLWGYDQKDVIDKSVKDFYETEKHARDIGRMLWESKDHRIENCEVTIKDSEGQIIPITLSAAFLFDDSRKRFGSIGVFRDLREIKRLEEQMLQSKKLETIRILAGSVIHHVKHDIGTCLFYVDTLYYKCDKEKEAHLAKIYRNIKDALWNAVEELQDVLIAGSPKPLQMEKMSIEDVFHNEAEAMLREAKARGIEFSIKYPESKQDIWVDADQIRRAFWNLFNNSVYAVLEKRGLQTHLDTGRIDLSISIHDGRVELVWCDTGCGISKEALPHIFEAFFTNKKSSAGSGLGLYIVKSVIESHKGQVMVQSDLGLGTCFRIQLPISQD